MLERHFNTPDRKSFRATTRLYAGRDARLDLPKLLPSGPVILVIDQLFAESDLARALKPAVKISVSGEPTSKQAQSLIAICAGQNAGAVVALGGGSTIDTAKAVHCALSFPGGTPRDAERPANAPLLISLPTTAGSGSETSRFFILSDADGVKCSHRAWSFAPDVALLDPALIRDSGKARLVLGAFDAFVHLWETLICRNERAPFVDMLALEGIGLIGAAMFRLAENATLDDELAMGLQTASAYGGYAISNVRTGLIHTLGESLAAQVALSHPETLYVFFESALDHYREAVAPEIARLDLHLAARLGPQRSFEALIVLWRRLFDELKTAAHIEKVLQGNPVDCDRLLATAARDVVLVKENPALLTPDILARLVTARFAAPRPARTGTGGVGNC